MPSLPLSLAAIAIAISSLSSLSLANAQTLSKSNATNAAVSAQDALTLGEVRKIDKIQGKITLRHEEIKNIDMPPMTMVFRVASPALLDGLKVGDKVQFVAEEVKGNLQVKAISLVK